MEHERTVSEEAKAAAPGDPPEGGWRLSLAAAGLVAAVAWIYWPVVGHDFVKFDDHHYILESPVRDGLTPAGVAWAFTAFHSGNWHPLTWISHMLDVSLFGLRPAGHHVVSIVLHAANAVALLLALHRLTAAPVGSAIVSALFAVHPLRVESVAWVAERKDVLSGACFMLTLLAYERYARRPFSVWRYAAVCAATAAGLLAKPMLVTLPCVLLLFDWWPLGRLVVVPRRCVLEKLPLFALVAASAAMTVLAQGDAVSSLERLPFVVRCGNAARALAWYVGVSFWPSRLAALYPYDHAAAASGAAVAAVVTLLALSAAAAVAGRWTPAVPMGWLWFFGMLVPVLGIVQVGSQPMADRFTYLPGIGLAIAVVFGSAAALRGLAASRAWPSGKISRLAVVVATLAIVCFAAAARLQVGHWANTETLWRRAVAVTVRNDRALDNLGWTLAEAGRMDEAAGYFAAGLAINPSRADSANALGLHLLATDRPAAAAEFFDMAIRAEPDLPQSYANLGIALARLGRPAAARAAFERSVALDPDFIGGRYNLAQCLLDVGDLEAAERHLSEVVRRDPAHPRAAATLDRLRSRLRLPMADPAAAAPLPMEPRR